MSKFKHFCLYERQRIEWYLKRKKSRQFIASKLERSKSSIHDEIKSNSVNGVYNAKKAHHNAYVTRRGSKIQCMKVSMDLELRDFVEACIEDDQTPEGTSGRLREVRKDLQYASTKAIYKFVYSPLGRLLERHLYSKAVARKGGPKRGKPVAIDGRTMVDQRPKVVGNRLQFGHYEGDFIESGKDGKGSLLVIVERKTRYPFLKYLENRDTATVNQAVNELIGPYPVRSLTIDNDISFQKHIELSELLDAAIFFCHPQSPNEKGTIENRNKAIRRYVKKRSDLSKFDSAYFAMVEQKLRTRFMECLGYKTPAEAWAKELRKQKMPLVRGIIKREEIFI
jgi:transposase, IS30 family